VETVNGFDQVSRVDSVELAIVNKLLQGEFGIHDIEVFEFVFFNQSCVLCVQQLSVLGGFSSDGSIGVHPSPAG